MAQLSKTIALVTGASRGGESLFDRIRQGHGRLDVLVNNVWGGYEDSHCRPLPLVPFWEQSLTQWDRMFVSGVRAHLVASRLAVPLVRTANREHRSTLRDAD